MGDAKGCFTKPSETQSNGHRCGKSLVEVIAAGKKCVWNKKVKGTQMEKFKGFIENKYGIQLKTYWDLHRWSVENYKTFWAEIWDYFGVIYSKPYEQVVKEGELLIDAEWFPGARLNFTENMLRYRDDRTAIIYADQQGNEKKITYAELYSEVKRYAAAFRKQGLKKGDTVACYMPHLTEAVYIHLAAASIGAVFGGPSPYYGAEAAAYIIRELNAKYLFTVDVLQDEDCEVDITNNVRQIANEVKSLKKTVVIRKDKDSNLSGIRNCCLLEEFLRSGETSPNVSQELTFEQLPCNHPLFVSFTSGTTGRPKGLIHSFTYLLFKYVQYAFHDDITREDVMMTVLPVGWNVWNGSLMALAMGATLLIYNGFPHFLTKHYYWDLISKYKVTNTWFVPSTVDRMDKEGIVPRPGCDLTHLRRASMGGSPVKLQNFEYFARIGHENLFVSCNYGSTEFVGAFTGSDVNLPQYSGEMQVPALGLDMRILDDQGNEVIGQVGEVVVGMPLPSMPVRILLDRKTIEEKYFSKYKGFWALNDEGWRDPETKGFVVIGRSDETLNQDGERFGPGDIYFAIHSLEELSDYLCVGQTSADGEQRAVLFVKVKEGYKFTKELVEKIKNKIVEELDTDFVPRVILEAKAIPYNLNKKRLEILVKKIIATNRVPEVTNVKNPKCLPSFCNIPELQTF